MGIKLSDPEKVQLKSNLKEALIPFKLNNEKDVNLIYTSIIQALEANSRWIQIEHADLVALSERFDKRIPEGDFRTNFGRIMVRRLRGVIDREYYSESTIVRGWHRDLINQIRNVHRLPCDRDLTRALFDLCQPFILAHKENANVKS